MYGAEEDADQLIERLCEDKVTILQALANILDFPHSVLSFFSFTLSIVFQDPLLRYGGMYTIAMAYAGTANNKAIRKLLHVAVSDVNDDVRRASVISLGYFLPLLK